jgi:hypothetical protein
MAAALTIELATIPHELDIQWTVRYLFWGLYSRIKLDEINRAYGNTYVTRAEASNPESAFQNK